jgi:hypothetical protein
MNLTNLFNQNRDLIIISILVVLFLFFGSFYATEGFKKKHCLPKRKRTKSCSEMKNKFLREMCERNEMKKADMNIDNNLTLLPIIKGM